MANFILFLLVMVDDAPDCAADPQIRHYAAGRTAAAFHSQSGEKTHAVAGSPLTFSDPVPFNVGPGCGLKLSPFVAFHSLFHSAAGAGDDCHPGLLQNPESLGAAVAGDQHFRRTVCQDFSGLDARPLGEIEILCIFDNLDFHGFRIDNDEILAPAETGIDGSGQVSAG
jgi:hypothetical protein